MNVIAARCEELAKEGWSISAVTIHLRDGGVLDVVIDRNGPQLPHGEDEGKLPHHEVTVDTTDLPKGITVTGFARPPVDKMELRGNAEQAEALIVGVKEAGAAKDWAVFDGCRWLTKPDKWNSVLRRIKGAKS